MSEMKRDRGGDLLKNEVTNLTHGGELEQGAAITLLETEEEEQRHINIMAAARLPVRLRIDEDAAVVAVGCLVAALPLVSTSALFWRRLKKL
jgi:hypothetical protein